MPSFETVMAVSFVGHGPDLEQLVMTAHLAVADADLGTACTGANAHTIFTTLMGPLLPFMNGTASYTHDKTLLRIVAGTSIGTSFEHIGDAGTTNSGVSAPANIALAAVMQRRAVSGGRRGNGRIFIPFAAASQFSINGVADFSGYGALSDITTAWSSNIVLAGLEGDITASPIIWHRGTTTGELVDTCAFSTRMGVQRRRRAGRGA